MFILIDNFNFKMTNRSSFNILFNSVFAVYTLIIRAKEKDDRSSALINLHEILAYSILLTILDIHSLYS